MGSYATHLIQQTNANHMSRWINLGLFTCLVLGGGFIFGPIANPIEEGRSRVFQGYLTNSPEQWREGIRILEQALTRTPDDAILQEELALARYGLIGYCIASESCSDTEDLLDNTEELLEKVVKAKPNSGRAHALLGSTLAMKIGLSPAKAIFLGPSSSRHIEKGTKLGANEATVWVEMGNMKFHAPALFGGDKEEAVKCFTKARKLFDQYPQQKAGNWQYLHTMAWLGQSLEATGKASEARSVYEAVLEEYPEFSWVKNELLPKLQTQATR